MFSIENILSSKKLSKDAAIDLSKSSHKEVLDPPSISANREDRTTSGYLIPSRYPVCDRPTNINYTSNSLHRPEIPLESRRSFSEVNQIHSSCLGYSQVQTGCQYQPQSPVMNQRFIYDTILMRNSYIENQFQTNYHHHQSLLYNQGEEYLSFCRSRRRGGQVRFTTEQTRYLEDIFISTKYINPAQRKQIAVKLNLHERQVKTWFQNRRAKWRKFQVQSDDPSAQSLDPDDDLLSQEDDLDVEVEHIDI